MTDRDWQDRGRPGEQSPGGVTPVVGDIERTTTRPRPSPPAGPGGGDPGTGIQALRGLSYPLVRDDLVRAAAQQRAPGELLSLLARLPNRVYVSAEDVAGEIQRTPAGGLGVLR